MSFNAILAKGFSDPFQFGLPIANVYLVSVRYQYFAWCRNNAKSVKMLRVLECILQFDLSLVSYKHAGG